MATESRNIGVWIDQERAILVEFKSGNAQTSEIESGASGNIKVRGGVHAQSGQGGRLGGASHTKADNKRLARLADFYSEVAAALEKADRVALIGPGQAKKRLAKLLGEQHNPKEIVSVTSAEKRTGPQIVAQLREILDPAG